MTAVRCRPCRMGALAKIFDLPMDKIEIVTMFAGGSFGRRANADADYQVEAALAFAMTDRTRPVKLVWSREDDIQGGAITAPLPRIACGWGWTLRARSSAGTTASPRNRS